MTEFTTTLLNALGTAILAGAIVQSGFEVPIVYTFLGGFVLIIGAGVLKSDNV